jgi:hypothetical protein
MRVGSIAKGINMKWLRRCHQILPSATMIAVLGLFGWVGRDALAANDRGWEITILGATEDMPAQDFERIVIEAFPPGLLDPELNFTHSDAYRPDARYRLILVFHSDSVEEHISYCQHTDEDGEGAMVGPHGFGGMTGSTNVTAAFCQGNVSLNTADNSLTGSVQPGSASFAFLVGDVLKQLFPDGYAVLPRPRN